MIGVVVRGGPSEPLAPLGVPDDVALAPFAACYRLADFAYASLRNSGIHATPPEVPGATRPGGRLLAALRSVARLPRIDRNEPVVVLVADHILDADLRAALAYHDAAGADLGLLCVPADSAPDASLLDVDVRGIVRGTSAESAEAAALSLTWTGDLIVRAGSLARLLATL